MTIESLQQILRLEEELAAAEQAEEKKAAVWLKEQQEEIRRHYEEQIRSLEERKGKVKKEAQKAAEVKAGEIQRKAGILVDYLDNLADDLLRKSVQKQLERVAVRSL